MHHRSAIAGPRAPFSASISEANLSIGYSSDLMGERETTELASVEQVTEAVGEDDSCHA